MPTILEIDPQHDPRWTSLVESHPQSSVFHTVEWLEALRRTYGYPIRAFTTGAASGSLANGIVFCQVDSFLTGSRLVSLPFSDHCEPLVQGSSDLQELLSGIRERTADKFKRIEIRPRSIDLSSQSDVTPSARHCFHVLDLRPGIEELYSHLHKNSIQRKIRRAEREHVAFEQGRSELLLAEFYQLLLLTRRRQGLPPQPFAWFRNLLACLGDRLTIRVARTGERPIASILTLRHKETIVYKYGCSDERFHNLGAMPSLFWQTIQEAHSGQLKELDLGRSEQSNLGLVRFKNCLGATPTFLNYWLLSGKASAGPGGASAVLNSTLVQSVLSRLPDRLFRLAGEIFYRHVG